MVCVRGYVSSNKIDPIFGFLVQKLIKNTKNRALKSLNLWPILKTSFGFRGHVGSRPRHRHRSYYLLHELRNNIHHSHNQPGRERGSWISTVRIRENVMFDSNHFQLSRSRTIFDILQLTLNLPKLTMSSAKFKSAIKMFNVNECWNQKSWLDWPGKCSHIPGQLQIPLPKHFNEQFYNAFRILWFDISMMFPRLQLY